MQETQFQWYDDTLSVADNDHVEGSAFYGSFADGYDVVISVTSYDYERNGETKTNHVPHVVVSDSSGSIVSEPHTRDSHDPQTAINNAKQAGRYVVENPMKFI